MVLELEGMDVTSSLQPKIQVQAPTPYKPNTTGLQAVNEGTQIYSQSLARESSSLSPRLESLQQGFGSQGRAITAAQQSASDIAQVKLADAKSGKATDLFGTLVESVTKIIDDQKRAKQKQQAVQAYVAVQDLKAAWSKDIFDRGVPQYRDALLSTLSQFDLAGEDRIALTKDGYSLATDYTDGNVKAQQEVIKQSRQQLSEVTKQRLLLDINSDLAKIKADPYADSTAAMQSVDNRIANFLNQPGISEHDKVMSLSAALGATLQATDTHNVAYVEIQRRLTALQEYANQEYAINQQLREGTIDASTANAKKQYARTYLGVHPSYQDSSPYAAEEFTRQGLQLQTDIQNAQQQNVINGSQAIQLSDDAVSVWAWNMIKDPSLVVSAKSDKVLAANPGIQRAIEIANMYQQGNKDQQQLVTRRQALVSEIAGIDKQDVTWFVNQARNKADPNINKQIDAMSLGVVLQQNQPLTPEQAKLMQDAFANYRNAKIQELQLLNQQIQGSGDVLKQYGIYGSPQDIEQRMKAKKAAVDAAQKQFEELRQQAQTTTVQGTKPPFEMGTGSKDFATITYKGKQTRLPFPIGTQTSVTGNYGEDRGTHLHSGIDLPVPVGTPLISVVSGVVDYVGTGGSYGYLVDIRGDDGKMYRYAHMTMNSAVVKVGQRVQAGQFFGKSGNTGRSTGPHLHFEVRDPKIENGIAGTVDPLEYLGNAVNNKNFKRSPRYNADVQNMSVPQGAIPLTGGYYTKNGKLYRVQGDRATGVPSPYTTANPMRDSYAGNGNPSLDANHGYRALNTDKQFARAINQGARELGIPGQWLADLMAFETGGTFSPAIPNGGGAPHYGLIQCGTECQADVGVTQAQLRSMSPAEQIRRVVVPYLKNTMRYAGVKKLKGVEWLVAAIWGGNTMLKDVDQRGAEAVLDPRNREGKFTFVDYLNTIGSHAGRKYNHLGLRGKRAEVQTHDKFFAGCPACAALQASGGFLIHEGVSDVG